MAKDYRLSIDTARNVLNSMFSNAKTLMEMEALSMAIDIMQNMNTKDVIADDITICELFKSKSDYVKRERGEWVSVKDRLPDKDGRYLVAMKSGDGYHISTRKFKSSEPPTWWKGNVYGFWSRNTCGVRYWQPLPEPPKDNPDLLKGGIDNG